MRNTEFEDERRPPNPPLHSEKIVTDRKIFFLDLKENDRGKFIKITEDVRGRRDTIILPLLLNERESPKPEQGGGRQFPGNFTEFVDADNFQAAFRDE